MTYQQTAQKLTSLFETNETGVPINNVSNENDGRGYTCGWAGFTTADQEVVEFVKRYTELQGTNHLSGKIYKELIRLSTEGCDETDVLDQYQFKMHWQNGCFYEYSKESFRKAYEETVDYVFGSTAKEHCEKLNLVLPISYVVLFDTGVQHGWDSDLDSAASMIEKTWRPEIDEKEFLESFLKLRKEILENPHNKETKEEWAQSVGRVDSLRQILEENLELTSPIKFKWEEGDYEF